MSDRPVGELPGLVEWGDELQTATALAERRPRRRPACRAALAAALGLTLVVLLLALALSHKMG